MFFPANWTSIASSRIFQLATWQVFSQPYNAGALPMIPYHDISRYLNKAGVTDIISLALLLRLVNPGETHKKR
jgi:hypothetical protein